MSEWFLARAGAVYGPYRIEQLREMNLTGELHGEDYYCLQGTESWVPHPVFVREQCEDPHPAPAPKRGRAKPEPKPDWRLEPPSEKQTVYLVFLGFPAPTTKGQAAELIEAASNNPMLADRRDEWVHARLKLYPGLYAEEAQRSAQWAAESRAGRAEAYHEEINSEASNDPESCPFKKISLKEAQAVISYLDTLGEWDKGQWGEQRSMADYALREQFLDKALALKFPDKLKKNWRWKFEL